MYQQTKRKLQSKSPKTPFFDPDAKFPAKFLHTNNSVGLRKPPLFDIEQLPITLERYKIDVNVCIKHKKETELALPTGDIISVYDAL
jgi:hypothetical protein